MNRYRLCCYCCCADKKNENLKYEGKHLVVKEPDEPSAIKWENLEISKGGRAWRKCVIVVVGLIAFLLGFVFIYYLKYI